MGIKWRLFFGVLLFCAGLFCLAQQPRAQLTLTGVGTGTFGGAAAYQGPGDIVSGATYFWSCTRGYTAAYASGGGNACDVQRISDSKTCTIVLTASGFADMTTTYCNSATQSVPTFCALANDCGFTKIYDQTSNGNVVTQTLASTRYFVPHFSGFGTCLAIDGNNGLVAPVMSGTFNSATLSQPFSYVAVGNTSNTSSQQDLAADVTSGFAQLGVDQGSFPGDVFIFSGALASTYPTVFTHNAWQTVAGLFNAASSKTAEQGTVSSVTGSVGTNGITNGDTITFGAAGTGIASWTGLIEEVALYPSDISASFTSISNNQRNTACGSF
jgi:hypothetical protein